MLPSRIAGMGTGTYIDLDELRKKLSSSFLLSKDCWTGFEPGRTEPEPYWTELYRTGLNRYVSYWTDPTRTGPI